MTETSEIVDHTATLVECTEDEFHYTEHVWLCKSTETVHLFICEHCSQEAREDLPAPDSDGINLAEYGGCDTPIEGKRNSDGRVYQDGKWWKDGPGWQELYIEANAIVDTAFRNTCVGAITNHALSLLFGIPHLQSYTEILKSQQRLVAKDKAEQPFTTPKG